MNRWVDISFDCLPLRSVGRLDIPLDASPKYRSHCERIRDAMAKHGSHNAYFIYNGRCTYHLANSNSEGVIEFEYEGTVLTNEDDQAAKRCDLKVNLRGETCNWLTEPIVEWFQQTVTQSMRVEFDRYIEAGDLSQTKKRIEQIQAASDDASGYVGMYL